jgi:hypothetical protein
VSDDPKGWRFFIQPGDDPGGRHFVASQHEMWRNGDDVGPGGDPVDADRPGQRGDAQETSRWIAVYTELVTVTQHVLARARDGSPTPDLELLEAHLDDLRQRLAFWRMRRGADLLNGK